MASFGRVYDYDNPTGGAEYAIGRGVSLLWKLGNIGNKGRVFWVGTGSQEYAKKFALEHGLEMLDMTWYGKAGVVAEKIIKPISRNASRKMWDGLSYVFARTANEPIYTVFGTYANEGIHMSRVGTQSTWFRIEYPTLTKYGKSWTPTLTPN